MQQRHADTAALHTHSTQPKLEATRDARYTCGVSRYAFHAPSTRIYAPRAPRILRPQKNTSFQQVHTSQGSLGCDVVVVRHPLFRIVPGVEASFTIY
jgi:hypothetical protein